LRDAASEEDHSLFDHSRLTCNTTLKISLYEDAAGLSFVRIIGNPVLDGSSSGANLIAAKKVRESYPELQTVATLFCDEGEKYISEHFAAQDTVRVDASTFT